MPDAAANASETNGKTPWWTLPVLAVLAEAIFAGALIASCLFEDTTLRTTMFTGALAQATVAAQFFFGSSAGSQRKDEQLAAARNGTTTTTESTNTGSAAKVTTTVAPPQTP